MKLSPVSTGYCKALVPLHMIGPAMRWNDSGTPKNPDKRKETCVPCDINQTYPPSKHNNKDCQWYHHHHHQHHRCPVPLIGIIEADINKRIRKFDWELQMADENKFGVLITLILSCSPPAPTKKFLNYPLETFILMLIITSHDCV